MAVPSPTTPAPTITICAMTLAVLFFRIVGFPNQIRRRPRLRFAKDQKVIPQSPPPPVPGGSVTKPPHNVPQSAGPGIAQITGRERL